MKVCMDCKEPQKLEDFYPHKGMASGRLNRCKFCCREMNKTSNGNQVRTCDTCGKEFRTTISEVKRGGGHTCSRQCYYKRLARLIEEKNKGMKMTYAGVHIWIKRVAGRPKYCEECKTSDEATFYDWSNISGEYKRSLEDWQRLCRRCHINYDIKHHGKSDKFRKTLKKNSKERRIDL